MQYSEIIKQVQTAAQIDDKEKAQKAIQATLETLKERIIGDEASNLAAQLPEEIGQHLRGREGKNGQYFSLQEFYERVGKVEGVDSTAAAAHVKGVFSVLNSAVSAGEFDNIKNDLPDDYRELFAAAS
ncbi:MAG: DUF2267 domain-containing protein [Phormidesmis sp.]